MIHSQFRITSLKEDDKLCGLRLIYGDRAVDMSVFFDEANCDVRSFAARLNEIFHSDDDLIVEVDHVERKYKHDTPGCSYNTVRLEANGESCAVRYFNGRVYQPDEPFSDELGAKDRTRVRLVAMKYGGQKVDLVLHPLDGSAHILRVEQL